MHEGIPGSRWELMEGARHMCFVDRHELFYGNVYSKRSGPAE